MRLLRSHNAPLSGTGRLETCELGVSIHCTSALCKVSALDEIKIQKELDLPGMFGKQSRDISIEPVLPLPLPVCMRNHGRLSEPKPIMHAVMHAVSLRQFPVTPEATRGMCVAVDQLTERPQPPARLCNDRLLVAHAKTKSGPPPVVQRPTLVCACQNKERPTLRKVSKWELSAGLHLEHHRQRHL